MSRRKRDANKGNGKKEISHRVKRVKPKTYSLALILVALFILLQIIAIASIFWLRQAVVTIDTLAPEPTAPAHIDPLRMTPSHLREAASQQTEEKIEAWVQPSGRLDIQKLTRKQKRIAALYKDAEKLTEQKQLGSAKSVLVKALELAPDDPATLVRLARLDESISNFTGATEYWQKLENVAQKIENSDLEKLSQERLVWLKEQNRRMQAQEEIRKRLLSLPKKIFVDQTRFEPSPLPSDPSQIEAYFSVRSTLPSLSPDRMRLQVFFYDVLPNGKLIPAKIQAVFESPSPDWATNKSESLKVSYQRSNEPEGRRYYGYILRLMYEGEVQYEQAEPLELLKYLSAPQ